MLVNLNGNIVNRFGDRFPVPFMEKIKVSDDSIEINLSLYFMKDNADEGDVLWNEYINSLSDLQYSIVMVPDFVAGANGYDPYGLSSEELMLKYGPIDFNNTETNLFSKLLSNDINVLNLVIANDQNTVYVNDSEGSLPDEEYYGKDQRFYYGSNTWFKKINHSNVLLASQLSLNGTGDEAWIASIHYDSSDNEIVKYMKTLIITDTSGFLDGDNDPMVSLVAAMRNGLKTHLVAFTTSLDNTVYPNGFTDEQKENIMFKNGQANILFSQISDLSYERVSEDSTIKGSNANVFKTPSGEPYDGDVLQSIESVYYGNSQINNQSIIDTFSDLIISTNDQDVQEKIDSLAYIISVHGKEPSILRRLNEYRKTFIETSTATPVGRMHEKFEIRLYNANNAVKKGTPLTRTLNLSPVVIDATTSFLSADPSTPSYTVLYTPEQSNNFIYTKKAKLGAYALPSGEPTSREDLLTAAESFRLQADLAKETRDEELKNAEEDYGAMLNSLIRAIVEAYIYEVHEATGGDENENSIHNIEIYTVSKLAGTAGTVDGGAFNGYSAFHLFSGLIDGIDGFNSLTNMDESIYATRLYAGDSAGAPADDIIVTDADKGRQILAYILSFLQHDYGSSPFDLRTTDFSTFDFYDRLQDVAQESKADETDASELFSDMHEWWTTWSTEAINARAEGDNIIGVGHMLGSIDSHGSIANTLNMFETDVSRDDAALRSQGSVQTVVAGGNAPSESYIGSAAVMGGTSGENIADLEALATSVLGSDAVINIPYTVFPMLRRSQVSPTLLELLGADAYDKITLTGGGKGTDPNSAFEESASWLANFAAGEYQYDLGFQRSEYDYDTFLNAVASANNTALMYAGAGQSGMATDILPGASIIFESEQLIDFTDDEARQKYLDAFNTIYGMDKAILSPFRIIEATGRYPSVSSAASGYFRQLRFAAICNIIEILLTPFCTIDISNTGNLGINNLEAALKYEKFVKHYQIYLQKQKEYYLYSKMAESYENLALTLSEDGVEKIFSHYNYYLNGYVFFDYEKAWHTTSNISKVLNTYKIENIFGRAFCHTFFNLKKARAEKMFDEDERFGEDDYIPPQTGTYPAFMKSRGYIESSFHENAHMAAVPVVSHAELVSTSKIASPQLAEYAGTPMGRDLTMNQEDAADLQGGVMQHSPSGIGQPYMEYSQILTRAFRLIGEDANNNYRLVCFEFQDVDGSYSAIPEEYESGSESTRDGNYNTVFIPNTPRNSLLFTVTVSDRTADLLNVLIKQYYDAAFVDYEFYYQSAIEECSFNSDTDMLNDFFVESIIEKYSSDPHLAPWYRVAFIYNMHLDLLSNLFNGDVEQIKIGAFKDLEKLHPRNTTLAELEAYRSQIRNLYEDYYSPDSGTISTQMNTLSVDTNNEIVFGGHAERGGIMSRALAAANVTNLPNPSNIDPYAYAAGTESGGFIIRAETVEDIT